MSEVKEVQEAGAARVGTTLKDKWALLRLIGIGGTGAVYEARHRNGKRVAVKIMHEHLGGSNIQRARFMAEGHAANRVGHPAVVSVLDEDVDEHGSPFLVLDFLEGMTVAQRAERLGGRLAPEEALKFVDELLDVLVAAHAQSILHRDIKPENLFLTTSGELKVLDFGIAHFAERALASFRTESGTLLGTPAFMSPEQAAGNFDELDERTDIWSAGATLFTLLSSELVHPAPNGNQQVALAMTRPARSLATAAADLPKALVAVVDRALCFSPADRWRDAKAMQRAVRLLRDQWTAIQSAPDLVPAELSTLVDVDTTRTTLANRTTSGFSRRSDPGRRSRSFWLLGLIAAAIAFIVFASSKRIDTASAPAAIAPRGPASVSVHSAVPVPAPPAAPIKERIDEPESRTPAAAAREPSTETRGKPKPRKERAPAATAPSSPLPDSPGEESDKDLMNHRY